MPYVQETREQLAPVIAKRNRARWAVDAAIRRGVLVRPETCSECGQAPRRGTDGRSLIQAHHRDYDKPLVVEWLCVDCHRAETPSNPRRNERATLAVYSDALIQAVKESPLSSRAAARVFGMSDRYIRQLRRGGWRKPAPPAPVLGDGGEG